MEKIDKKIDNITKAFFGFVVIFILTGITALLFLEIVLKINDRWFNYFTSMFASSVGFFGVFITIASNIGKEKQENYIKRNNVRRIRIKAYRKNRH